MGCQHRIETVAADTGPCSWLSHRYLAHQWGVGGHGLWGAGGHDRGWRPQWWRTCEDSQSGEKQIVMMEHSFSFSTYMYNNLSHLVSSSGNVRVRTYWSVAFILCICTVHTVERGPSTQWRRQRGADGARAPPPFCAPSTALYCGYVGRAI